jgi:hypothetical protein
LIVPLKDLAPSEQLKFVLQPFCVMTHTSGPHVPPVFHLPAMFSHAGVFAAAAGAGLEGGGFVASVVLEGGGFVASVVRAVVSLFSRAALPPATGASPSAAPAVVGVAAASPATSGVVAAAPTPGSHWHGPNVPWALQTWAPLLPPGQAHSALAPSTQVAVFCSDVQPARRNKTTA